MFNLAFAMLRFDLIRDLFGGMLQRLLDFRGLWDRAGADFHEIMRSQFESEGRVGGSPWAPLASAYLRWKIERGYPSAILERSGQLKRSFEGGAGAVILKDPKKMKIGTSVYYAKFHQLGTKTMPARKLITDKIIKELGPRWVGFLKAHLFAK